MEKPAYVEPIRSTSDTRDYRGFFLPNGLQVLLISDPTSDKCSAALDVHVGSYQDPAEIPGLAHFLEHMLFLGTEKYPDEKSYSAYLNAHGGSSNAYTSGEDTNFYFDITPPFFEEALDRFAQFFISPLFNVDATLREMQAVDSENSKNLQQDGWRQQQFLKSTCNPKHPFSKFATGNLKTLLDDPKEKNIDVRKALLEFHATWYSANIMKLAVYGTSPLDTLEEWVTSRFGPIRNLKLQLPTYDGPPFDAGNAQTVFQIVPVKDLRNVQLLWLFPGQNSLFRTKPAQLLAHLLGHEGPGSILSLLKSRGWANELIAGPVYDGTGFSIFTVQLELTQEGLHRVDEAIAVVFGYISMLKEAGPQEWVFEECMLLEEMKFLFKDKEDPSRYVSSLSSNMQCYPPEYVVSGPYVMDTYEPELIRQHLELLIVDSVRIVTVSKSFDEVADEVEHWYQARFHRIPCTDSQLKCWNNPSDVDEMHLPPPNIFIPTDFSLKDPPDPPVEFPSLVLNSKAVKIWHLQDCVFHKPKCNIFLEFQIPASYDTPRSAVATRLITRLIEDSLNEYAYAATLAELKFSLTSTIQGLQLNVKGYNHKQRLFLATILEQCCNLKVEPARLNLIKDSVLREYRNMRMDQPYATCIYESSFAIQSMRWHNEEYIQEMENDAPSASELQEFVPRLFSQGFVEGFIHGNVTAMEAKELGHLIHETVRFKPLHPLQFVQYRAVQLPVGAFNMAQAAFNPKETNSAIEVLYQIGVESVEENALLDLLAQVTSDLCFYQLRTVEQLGYIVWSGARRALGAQFFRVIVQSSTKDPNFLEDRVEAFLATLKEVFQHEAFEQEFLKHKKALISKKLEKEKTMTHLTNKHWSEIATHRYRFDELLLEVEFLQSATLAQFQRFVDTYVCPTSAVRRKLSMQVFGNGTEVPEEPREGQTRVTDVVAFKRKCFLFPMFA